MATIFEILSIDGTDGSRAMDAHQTLTKFLDKTIGKTLRERIVGSAAKPKTKAKFLNLLHHQLGGHISSECRVEELHACYQKKKGAFSRMH
jgi:hypothetical protein